MTRSATLVERLHELLAPLGFHRRKQTWNRRQDRFTEVLDLQISKAGDAATINVGVLDPDAHELCWGDTPSGYVAESLCTVRARVGQLIGDLDVWWELESADTPDRAVGVVKEYALPFLERMRSRQAMVVHLESIRPAYPPEAVYLAVLKHLEGARTEACSMLDGLGESLQGPWQEKVVEIGGRLGCSEAA